MRGQDKQLWIAVAILSAYFLFGGGCGDDGSSSPGGGGGGGVSSPTQWNPTNTQGGSAQPGSLWNGGVVTGGSTQPTSQWNDPQSATGGGVGPTPQCIPYPDLGPIYEPTAQNGNLELAMYSYIAQQRGAVGGGALGGGGLLGGGGFAGGGLVTTRDGQMDDYIRAHCHHMATYHAATALNDANPEGDNTTTVRAMKCGVTLGGHSINYYVGNSGTTGAQAVQGSGAPILGGYTRWAVATWGDATTNRYYFAVLGRN